MPVGVVGLCRVGRVFGAGGEHHTIVQGHVEPARERTASVTAANTALAKGEPANAAAVMPPSVARSASTASASIGCPSAHATITA